MEFQDLAMRTTCLFYASHEFASTCERLLGELSGEFGFRLRGSTQRRMNLALG